MKKNMTTDLINRMRNFDPDSPHQVNSNFAMLPFEYGDAQIVFLPVCWDVTSSGMPGSSRGPINILEQSVEIDLSDPNFANAYLLGHHFLPPQMDQMHENDELRKLYEKIQSDQILDIGEKLNYLNRACQSLHNKVHEQCRQIIRDDKMVGLVGGEHSVSFENIQAHLEKYPKLNVLQFDAHMDLRVNYQNLEYSHASVYYNVVTKLPLKKLYQIGVRDFSPFELDVAESDNSIDYLTARDLKYRLFCGEGFGNILDDFFSESSNEFYVSVDIDALEAFYCPNTGTPVPGGLNYWELFYILQYLIDRGKRIVGFDLCEVSGKGSLDGFNGAKVLYELSILAAKSMGIKPYSI